MAGLNGRFFQGGAGAPAFPLCGPLARLGGPGLALLLLASGTPSMAQDALRNTFPGRRIGGATRGECSSRLIVHLVPPSSVLAPGSAGLGLLQGPSASPVPLVVELRPLGRGGSPDATIKPLLQRTLPAMPMGITLLPLAAVNSPTVWESAYACGAAAAATAAPADPLSFVESISPPALSLLVPQGSVADTQVLAALGQLRQACGGTVATADLVRSFALEDVVRPDWPARLPVRCP
jgi:hypothetical protein